jgi:uncharacterized protein
MKVNVKRIPAGGEHLQGEIPATIIDWVDEDVAFLAQITYDLQAQIQNNALLVTGHLATPVRLRCSRCLNHFLQLLRVQAFVFHRELAGEDFVDLTENIREDILLELPQRALCRPDCPGLCPRCGTDLSAGACQCAPLRVDLRWHALDQLKLK